MNLLNVILAIHSMIGQFFYSLDFVWKARLNLLFIDQKVLGL